MTVQDGRNLDHRDNIGAGSNCREENEREPDAELESAVQPFHEPWESRRCRYDQDRYDRVAQAGDAG